jgi:photosystem II stability/assembly factor-like uncharacterized protein
MLGNNLILKTVNGGNNWYISTNSLGGMFIFFLNTMTGFIAGGTIHRTDDGGYTWIDLGLYNMRTVFFNDALTGYAAGTYSEIRKTTDGGFTWRELIVPVPYGIFNHIFFINSETGFAVGGKMNAPLEGVVIRTSNSGDDWEYILTYTNDVEFRSIDFPNATTGYLVGSFEYGSSGVIFKSMDAGKTWVQQGVTNKDLMGVDFVTPDIGYAVGESGMIIKTINGGVIWNSQASGTQNDLKSVSFVNSNIGYVAGASGSIHKTVNGGTSGPPFAVSGRVIFNDNQQPVPKGWVKAVKYDYNTGRIIRVDTARIESNGTYILRNVTVDTLDFMTYQDDEEPDYLLTERYVPTYYGNTIYWMNANRLYVNQNFNNINFSVPRIDSTESILHIGGGVYNGQTFGGLPGGYVYAKIGEVYKGYSRTNTNGLYQINSLPAATYTMIADRMGYYPGTKTVILSNYSKDTINFYLGPRYPIGIQNSNSEIPKDFSLHQNYPNPFNPVTNIAFSIPEETNVRLTVYDVIGREITVLIDQRLKPGSYRIDWNAEHYTSGMYFYRMQTDKYTDTKKMVLVK